MTDILPIPPTQLAYLLLGKTLNEQCTVTQLNQHIIAIFCVCLCVHGFYLKH